MASGYDEQVKSMVLKVNMLKDYNYAPKNVVLVTIDDIVEIANAIQPFTAKKLDEALAKEAHTQQAIDNAKRELLDTFQKLTQDEYYEVTDYTLNKTIQAERAKLKSHKEGSDGKDSM